MPAATSCSACGTGLREGARFCDACGAAVMTSAEHAEYKQVTVLFADVVHSMDIAVAVGAERLREIMAELVTRSAGVVAGYGGTVDKFTGDGIMALFGAPVALEDHALRACLASLRIQQHAEVLAAEVSSHDGVVLALRVGLNSGQVIAGDIGSGPWGYTAVGDQVGMAQRMESVAGPGGVMLSESTARLVADAMVLGDPEVVHVKGTDEAMAAYRLITTAPEREHVRRNDARLVGRSWELNTIGSLLDEASSGAGCVVNVVGPPGIGKSRIARESAALAAARGVEVFGTYCESHTSDIPFHVIARLLRAGFGVHGLSDEAARVRVRTQIPDAEAEDLLLLDDLLGIADTAVALPDIEADARRRRMTALVNSASLARTDPGIYVIEDVHWIDEVSESMLGDLLLVVPHTHSLVVVTYRPDYRGALAAVPGAQTIVLRPLSNAQTTALSAELLGTHPSVRGLAERIAGRAAGNPFFAEEIVRDLAERAVLQGERGCYVLRAHVADVSVPATLQATIAARIDRLGERAKQTLCAAAVIGSRFSGEWLTGLGITAVLPELIDAELIDQVAFTPHAAFMFRHPLIRAVAYESQLKADRAELHRRLAVIIEEHSAGAAEENAALIAEHLEAAENLPAAFAWHMRAGTWLTNRDITAARLSWQRARQVADRIPVEDPDRIAMRIAPRTLLCLSAWRAGGTLADAGFDELYELAVASGDKQSLAIGLAGRVSSLIVHARYVESLELADELTTLVDSIGDPALSVALLYAVLGANFQVGRTAEVLRVAQRMIDLSHGDPVMGDLIIGSPLGTATLLRGLARACVGDRRWREDIDRATALVSGFDTTSRSLMCLYKYGIGITIGLLVPDAAAIHDLDELLRDVLRSGDTFTVACARLIRGLVLLAYDGEDPTEGLELLAAAREAAAGERFTLLALQFIDTETALHRGAVDDLDAAIDVVRAVVESEYAMAERIHLGRSVGVLIELLLRRRAGDDVAVAQAELDRLAQVPVEPGFVLHEPQVLRLQALMARAHGDEESYRDLVARYRRRAVELGYDGHVATASAMS